MHVQRRRRRRSVRPAACCVGSARYCRTSIDRCRLIGQLFHAPVWPQSCRAARRVNSAAHHRPVSRRRSRMSLPVQPSIGPHRTVLATGWDRSHDAVAIKHELQFSKRRPPMPGTKPARAPTGGGRRQADSARPSLTILLISWAAGASGTLRSLLLHSDRRLGKHLSKPRPTNPERPPPSIGVPCGAPRRPCRRPWPLAGRPLRSRGVARRPCSQPCGFHAQRVASRCGTPRASIPGWLAALCRRRRRLSAGAFRRCGRRVQAAAAPLSCSWMPCPARTRC